MARYASRYSIVHIYISNCYFDYSIKHSPDIFLKRLSKTMKLSAFEPYDIILKEDTTVPEYNYSDDDDEPSYYKYGGYNGYDDDTIDSAFEGMPEATWNID